MTNLPSRKIDRNRLHKSLQENIITLLTFSTQHGAMLAQQVQPNQFHGDLLRLVAERLIRFWQKYNRPPRAAHLADLVRDILEQNDARTASMRNLLYQISALNFEEPDEQVVLDQLCEFQRQAQLTRGTMELAMHLQSGAADPAK